MTKEESESGKGGKDDKTASSGTEETIEEIESEEQPFTDKSEEHEGGSKKSNQPFPDLESANKSYGNLMKKHQEILDENKKIKSQSSEDDDSEDIDAKIDQRIEEREKTRLAREAESNTRKFFRDRPELLKDAEMLSEMETISIERPDLMRLEDPMSVIHAIAEQRLGKDRAAAQQQEREREERANENNEKKKKSSGHSYGASRKDFSDTDREEDTSNMTPQERDAYVREHQFD